MAEHTCVHACIRVVVVTSCHPFCSCSGVSRWFQKTSSSFLVTCSKNRSSKRELINRNGRTAKKPEVITWGEIFDWNSHGVSLTMGMLAQLPLRRLQTCSQKAWWRWGCWQTGGNGGEEKKGDVSEEVMLAKCLPKRILGDISQHRKDTNGKLIQT